MHLAIRIALQIVAIETTSQGSRLSVRKH